MTAYTWKQLNAITGGLSKPSKLPCSAYSIPNTVCSGYRKNERGTVCHVCYCGKNRYAFPAVQNALQRRLNAVQRALRSDFARVTWIRAVVESIKKTGDAHFRWFDSGDIYREDFLEMIICVAALTPHVSHWLPTQRPDIVARYVARKGWLIPKNLTVRVTCKYIDRVGGVDNPLMLPLSVVCSDRPSWDVSESVRRGSFVFCPAGFDSDHGTRCGDCRACWDPKVRTVVYKLH
jgi:hypothetical protein